MNASAQRPQWSAGPSNRLSVARLTLTDFRCYTRQRVEVDPRPVVLTGPNGAGKTNLLEALSFLVPGRGLRGARLADVVRRDPGADGPAPGRTWAVAARADTARGPVDLGTGLDPAADAEGRDRRVVRIDGETARGQADLAEHLSAVWLTPQMDRLFLDGASARRRFLDRLVFAFDPAHAGRVGAFERAMRERARLLRDGGDRRWVGALEETMAGHGVAVAAARRDMVARLAAYCGAEAGPFPGAGIDLDGSLEAWLDEGPALAAEDRFRARLADCRGRDAEYGGAAVGPHRSDLRVRHLGNGMPAEQCSTGEQKALLIALVLGHAGLLAAERGMVPLLLLDEVAAHLDRVRRDALFEALLGLGTQAWLTGTDPALFAGLGDRAQYLGVEHASVRPALTPVQATGL